jgi:acetamidase/formamidase
MGIQPELNGAMKEAVEKTDAFLVQRFGLTPSDAYSLASIAVDYAVAEDVDGNKVIYGKIPKAMFKAKTPYWLKK